MEEILRSTAVEVGRGEEERRASQHRQLESVGFFLP